MYVYICICIYIYNIYNIYNIYIYIIWLQKRKVNKFTFSISLINHSNDFNQNREFWLEENDEGTKRPNYVNYYGKKGSYKIIWKSL